MAKSNTIWKSKLILFSTAKRESKVKSHTRRTSSGIQRINPFRRRVVKASPKDSEDKSKKLNTTLLATGATLAVVGGASLIYLKTKGPRKPATLSPPKYPSRVDPPTVPKRSLAENAKFMGDYKNNYSNRIFSTQEKLLGITPLEKQAFRDYSGTGYEEMNSLARGLTTNLSKSDIDRYTASSEILQKTLLDKLPEVKLNSIDHYLQRASKYDANLVESWTSNPNSVFKDTGFLSTSDMNVSPEKALSWFRRRPQPNTVPVYMRIRPDSRGSGEMQGRFLVEGLTGNPDEKEVLFPMGSSFLIQAVKKVKTSKESRKKIGDFFYEVDMREINPKFNK